MKDITISSSNVFEDMELSEPAGRLAKAELARKIAEFITRRHLNQTQGNYGDILHNSAGAAGS